MIEVDELETQHQRALAAAERAPMNERYTGRARSALFAPLALALLLSACAPSQFAPVAWEPTPSSVAENVQGFGPLKLLPTLDGHGPETIVVGPDDWLYTGVKDGRILRFRPDGVEMEVFANTGGRANGLAFDGDGNLIVADSYRGLLSIDPHGTVQVLATEAEDQPFVFPDGLDIEANGTIWFTDATSRYPDGEFHYEILEGQRTGRLISYDPATRTIEVRASMLRFPNGVALGPGDEYILVNEMLAYRTLRHWIRGSKAGTTEVFVDGYSGLPDDIRLADDGLFWVAFAGYRISLLDWIQPYPRIKSALAHGLGWAVPDTDSPMILNPAFAIAIDAQGEVVHRLRDESHTFLGSTSVLEFRDKLFIGSISMNAVAVAPRPARHAAGRGGGAA
ncbi:MAG: SMP-30/gluconolactonase/LRE family protein [Candidatus Binatia bacterium]|nr:SMP-30/gluconolactonase/LRE family protein [Candidatus Binatia bacterium]